MARLASGVRRHRTLSDYAAIQLTSQGRFPPHEHTERKPVVSTNGLGSLARAKRRVFSGSPDQIRYARDFVSRMLIACPAAQDAILLVSELATNAVMHTNSGKDGAFAVTVRRTDTMVRVEVSDAGSAHAPAIHPDGMDHEAGRGLAIVEMIATRWGHHGSIRGRVVWFELDLAMSDPPWLHNSPVVSGCTR
jgi:serine/threonine-protein kinase RsbW